MSTQPTTSTGAETAAQPVRRFSGFAFVAYVFVGALCWLVAYNLLPPVAEWIGGEGYTEMDVAGGGMMLALGLPFIAALGVCVSVAAAFLQRSHPVATPIAFLVLAFGGNLMLGLGSSDVW